MHLFECEQLKRRVKFWRNARTELPFCINHNLMLNQVKSNFEQFQNTV